MEALVGNTLARILADKGYRGHNAPPDYRFRVFTSGQKRRVTPQIKRELRRRSAVEPVIGHLSPNTEWAAIISGIVRAMPSMPFLLPLATTSDVSSGGCSSCSAKSSSSSSADLSSSRAEITVLHGRLIREVVCALPNASWSLSWARTNSNWTKPGRGKASSRRASKAIRGHVR